MSNLIELYPGATVTFYTVYEYCLKVSMIEPSKINCGNFAKRTDATREKERLEAALPSKWSKNDDGRFELGGEEPETKWFHVKPRKFDIR